ncbi:MAG: hypothetical protein IJL92_07720 [Thermoguttaceae bacterium]|nr:hypothetical protein [Thermoguttaceae bacterium]
MKQIRIDFETENDKLSLGYNSLMLSFIKHAVETYDNDLYSEWFDKTRNASELGKSYTFSCKFPAPRFTRDWIFLGGNSFSFFLSTYDYADLMNLYNAFLGVYARRESYPAHYNFLRIANLVTLEMPVIAGNRALIKFDSALLARRHDREKNTDDFLSYNSEGFVDSLRFSADAAVKLAGLSLPVDDLELIPIAPRKTVVHYFNGMRVTGNVGEYEIRGSTELLNFLLLCGLGSATGSGHGKFRVVGY